MLDLKDCAINSDDRLTYLQESKENFDLNSLESITDFGFCEDQITVDMATTLPINEVVDTDSSPEIISDAKEKYLTNQYPNLSIISSGIEENDSGVLEVFSELITSESWSTYFNDFHNSHFFYGLQDYKIWLQKSGFKIKRLELVQKSIAHQGKEGLLGWIRTSWMPFTKSVPRDNRNNCMIQYINLYLEKNSSDSQGLINASVVRLKVGAGHTPTLETDEATSSRS
ncbi:hypothetical protein [Pleurocapsa sp. PCC 7319]|uniref:hypothetical protein n=1 Tax=Pleurocapsa sp. PCC 7319 TaxID=118161 RepID=UPI00034B1BAA|nr:hypothetical protein [Pleurocapsa sp. PCC 7319]